VSTSARAAILEHPAAPFTTTTVELGDPGTGEVLVRLVATGLCHTDLGVQAGGIPLPFPGIVGHEGAGIVEKVGPGVTSVSTGDQVLMSFTSCGDCASCAGGHPAYCASWLPRNLMGALRAADSAQVTRDGEEVGGHFFGQSSFAEYASPMSGAWSSCHPTRISPYWLRWVAVS
jgi:aryl-alcohol dehydrogenase